MVINCKKPCKRKRSTMLTVEQMVDIALGTPEIGAVNFNVLHALIHVIIQRLNIQKCLVEFKGYDSDRMEGIILTAKPGPILKLSEYMVDGADGKPCTPGKEKTGKEGGEGEGEDGKEGRSGKKPYCECTGKRKKPVDEEKSGDKEQGDKGRESVGGEGKKTQEKKAGTTTESGQEECEETEEPQPKRVREVKKPCPCRAKDQTGILADQNLTAVASGYYDSDGEAPCQTIVRVEPVGERCDSWRSRPALAHESMIKLEEKVAMLQDAFEALEQLPTNEELKKKAQGGGHVSTPVKDLWQLYNLNKRVEGCEGTIEKLASMIEDLVKETCNFKEAMIVVAGAVDDIQCGENLTVNCGAVLQGGQSAIHYTPSRKKGGKGGDSPGIGFRDCGGKPCVETQIGDDQPHSQLHNRTESSIEQSPRVITAPLAASTPKSGVALVQPSATNRQSMAPGTNPRHSVAPGTSTNPRHSVAPGTSTNPRQSVAPGTSSAPRQSVAPGTSSAPRQSVAPGGTLGGRQSLMPGMLTGKESIFPMTGGAPADQGGVSTEVPGTEEMMSFMPETKASEAPDKVPETPGADATSRTPLELTPFESDIRGLPHPDSVGIGPEFYKMSVSEKFCVLKEFVDCLVHQVRQLTDSYPLKQISTKLCAMVSMQKQVDGLEKEWRAFLSNCEAGGGGVQAFIQEYDKLKSTVETLNSQVAELRSERREMDTSIRGISQETNYLRKVKADLEVVEDLLAEKADTTTVNRKVSHDQFDAACDDLTRGLDEALDKLMQQEIMWNEAMQELQNALDSKLDKIEIMPLKEFINKKLTCLQEKLRQLAQLRKVAEAAGAKSRILRNLNCIACDGDVIMKMDNRTSYPNAPLPASKTIRPMLTYELDQVRKAMKKGFPCKAANHVEEALMDAQKKEVGIPLTNAEAVRNKMTKFAHFCNRYCGGSHTITTPQQRVTRIGHFLTEFGPQAIALFNQEYMDCKSNQQPSETANPDADLRKPC